MKLGVHSTPFLSASKGGSVCASIRVYPYVERYVYWLCRRGCDYEYSYYTDTSYSNRTPVGQPHKWIKYLCSNQPKLPPFLGIWFGLPAAAMVAIPPSNVVGLTTLAYLGICECA